MTQDSNLLVYMMMGLPGSGKSTFAKDLAKTLNAEIISTDKIRERLFGSEETQGSWFKINNEIKKSIHDCYSRRKNIVYDATNLKIKWRRPLIAEVNLRYPEQIIWGCWFLDVSLEICLKRNKNRKRVVPENVIKRMSESIDKPTLEEGFNRIWHIQEDSIDEWLQDFRKSAI